MKHDYKFDYYYKGRKRTYHILAATYTEALEFWLEYRAFLDCMGLKVQA